MQKPSWFKFVFVSLAGLLPAASGQPAPTHTVYITNPGYQVSDWQTGNLLRKLDLAGGARDIAVSADSTRLYVTLAFTNELLVINSSTDAILDRINVGTSPFKVAVTPDGKRAFVDISTGLAVVDLTLRTVIKTIAFTPRIGLQTFPNQKLMVLTPDGKKLYYIVGNGISVLDTTTLTPLPGVVSSKKPIILAAGPDSKHIYALLAGSVGIGNSLLVLDTANYSSTEQSIAGCTAPRALVLSPGGTRGYTLCGTQPPPPSMAYTEVLAFDLATLAIVDRVKVVFDADSLTITPDGKYVFYTEEDTVDPALTGRNALNLADPGPVVRLQTSGTGIAFSGPFFSQLDNNALLTSMRSGLAAPGCAPGSTYVVTATWRNNTANQYWRDVRAEVIVLTNGNKLASQQWDLTGDGVVGPGETMTGTFRLTLAACTSFTFKVTLIGESAPQ